MARGKPAVANNEVVQHTPDRQAETRAAFVKQGSDPIDVLKALSGATDLARTLWISFLTFGTYLVITVAGVDHKQLFLETPITLPLLNAQLPLVAFFWVAPILFLIFHLYLLINLKLLADQVHYYDALMEESELPEEARERVRLQLPNFMLVQRLSGTLAQRHSAAGVLLAFTTWMTLVFAPIILLLLIQLRFLPYHSEPVTRLHRFALLTDLMMVWYFWRHIRRKDAYGLRGSMSAAGGLAALCFSWLLATFPGEPQDGAPIQMMPWVFSQREWVGYERKQDKDVEHPWVPTLYEVLFTRSGSTKPKQGALPGFFTNTLLLPDYQPIDPDRMEKMESRQAGAKLEIVGRAISIDLSHRDFRNADFKHIVLPRANLDDAILDGATLDGAKLVAASLMRASLRSASLVRASLQGVTFEDASLQGASFGGSQLQAARLGRANLQGASLISAQMEGVDLTNASLDLASLKVARLERGDMEGVRLQGASLAGAVLFGVSFVGVSLHGASLTGAHVWRNEIEPDDADLSNLRHIAIVQRLYGPQTEKPRSLDTGYEALLRSALAGVPQESQQALKDKLASLDPVKPEPADAIDWTGIKGASLDAYSNILAADLEQIACVDGNTDKLPKEKARDLENAPYIIRGIVANGRLADAGSAALPLIEKMLAPGAPDCPGAAGLDADTLAKLNILKKDLKPDRGT